MAGWRADFFLYFLFFFGVIPVLIASRVDSCAINSCPLLLVTLRSLLLAGVGASENEACCRFGDRPRVSSLACLLHVALWSSPSPKNVLSEVLDTEFGRNPR